MKSKKEKKKRGRFSYSRVLRLKQNTCNLHHFELLHFTSSPISPHLLPFSLLLFSSSPLLSPFSRVLFPISSFFSLNPRFCRFPLPSISPLPISLFCKSSLFLVGSYCMSSLHLKNMRIVACLMRTPVCLYYKTDLATI